MRRRADFDKRPCAGRWKAASKLRMRFFSVLRSPSLWGPTACRLLEDFLFVLPPFGYLRTRAGTRLKQTPEPMAAGRLALRSSSEAVA